MHWIWSLNRKPPTCLPQGNFSDALAHLGWDIWIPKVSVQFWGGEDHLVGDPMEEAAARSCVNHPLYQSHIPARISLLFMPIFHLLLLICMSFFSAGNSSALLLWPSIGIILHSATKPQQSSGMASTIWGWGLSHFFPPLAAMGTGTPNDTLNTTNPHNNTFQNYDHHEVSLVPARCAFLSLLFPTPAVHVINN